MMGSMMCGSLFQCPPTTELSTYCHTVSLRYALPGCIYGVDTPERAKLRAATPTVEEMAKFNKADSLACLAMEGLYRAMGRPTRDAAKPAVCDACFSGDYPIGLTDELARPARGPKQLTLLAEYS